MAGIVLGEPTELYNTLNQTTKYSRLSEPTYLYLADVRIKSEYLESHVITAKRAKRKLEDENEEFLMPQDIEIECVQFIVVYDRNTDSLESNGPAVQYAKLLEVVSNYPIIVLNGGYQRFSADYPFFRTQKIFYMPQELDNFQAYPVEIIPGKLYMGNFKQACSKKIQKDLKIKVHVNVCSEGGVFFTGEQSSRLLHLPTEEDGTLYVHFDHTCQFIGISRSTCVVIAYLIYLKHMTLKDAWNAVKKCKANMQPHREFVQQLSKWEEKILKQKITDISETNF
ncbi:serine/threonine/tyrosine-interacting-like protein 1 isoform X1 [Callorhinchus milii]|uniref:serine/threonine/tyrosine-interacting-like protein 1 isoform X1 n=1 Tax=Callorhinchus milii TaxID=7868 RepID=UPI001C3FCA50|nr:serine/threonine/tyrosine-interacting-like protein 1 isoform X1 [Callorhinchus milii]